MTQLRTCLAEFNMLSSHPCFVQLIQQHPSLTRLTLANVGSGLLTLRDMAHALTSNHVLEHVSIDGVEDGYGDDISMRVIHHITVQRQHEHVARIHAFLLGTHPRVGLHSPIRHLIRPLLRMIVSYLRPIPLLFETSALDHSLSSFHTPTCRYETNLSYLG